MEQQRVRLGSQPLTNGMKLRMRAGFKRIWKARLFYLMLLPGVVYYIVYRYIPIYGIIIAFKDYDILAGMLKSPWADPWYKHFLQFYESPYFWQLIRNTILISLYKLIFGLVPPIILALLLNECRVYWFRSAVQTLSYMPHFLSWVIIYGIAIVLLSQDTGLINRWLEMMGIPAIPFLTSTEWFRSVLVGTDIWQNLGWSSIIYLAAIAGIDPTLYEAARVDGASRLRMIWHITLPGIRHIIVLMLILKLGHLLDAGFEQIYIMYNIHVYPVADILDTWVFRTGLEQLNFSLATAVGLFKSVIGFILVLVSNQLARKGGQEIW